MEDHELPQEFNDPQLESELREIYEEEMEISMNWAYQAIHEMSFETWMRVTPIPIDRKKRIIENMIHWFQEREEYEKCAFLHKGLQKT